MHKIWCGGLKDKCNLVNLLDLFHVVVCVVLAVLVLGATLHCLMTLVTSDIGQFGNHRCSSAYCKV